MSYKTLCEEIYRDWRSDPSSLSEFSDDFAIEHLPEPYLPVRFGETGLVVLNNNPGQVHPFQHHSSISSRFSAEVAYKEISHWLMAQYIGKDSEINRAAKSRIARMFALADALGCEGIENVEMFFLHSSRFNKDRFLSRHASKDLVRDYHSALSAYLADKKVVIIAAVASNRPLSIDGLSQSRWLLEQARLARFDWGRAEIRYTSYKGVNPTSGIVRFGDKILICCMGMNRVPVTAAETLANWDA